MAQSIFSNVVIAALSRVIVVILGLFATALTVRIVSVETFGAYSLVLTIGTLLQLVADFGLYLTASREIGASQGKRNDTIRHIVSLRIALLLLVFIGGCIAFASLPSLRGLVYVFFVVWAGLVFQSLSQLMMGVFQAYGVIWKATLGDIVGRGVQVLFLSTLFWRDIGHSAFGIALSFAAGLFVLWAIHATLVPRNHSLLPKVSLHGWKYLLQTSWPIAIMLILNVIYFRSDILILSYFRSAEEVGFYSLAYKVIENGLFFPAMLGGLLLPHMSAAVAFQKKEQMKDIISQGLMLSLFVAIICIAILIVFAQPIVDLIAGSGFTESVPLLRILAIGLAIMFAGNIFGFALIALSKQRVLAVLYGFLVIFNIGLNIFLVPSYGAVAASWITVATEAIAMSVAGYVVFVQASWKLPLFRILLALGAASVAVYVGSILPLAFPLIPRLLLVGGFYGWIAYAVGLWDAQELRVLKTLSSV